MGGWTTEIGVASDFNERLARFEKTFNVNGVPSLRVETHIHTDHARTIMWAWNRFRVPDVYVKKTDGGVIIVLCGVITDLGSFGPLPNNQESTVSLILRLWIEHRDNLIKELNGSFSCLFYDPNKDEATLYTDRFASRSVWFTKENNMWIVGNFPSAIASLKKDKPKIDPVGLWSLFATSRHVGTHGIYNEIRNMKAGQVAVMHRGGTFEVSQWWQRRYKPKNSISPRDWGERIAQAIRTSAKRLYKVTPDAHLFLSGGLDSRIAAAALGRGVKTHTLCSQYNMEARIASQVARQLNTDHQTIVRTPYWYLDTFESAALIGGGNYFTKHAHFIIPVQQICASTPSSNFFLGDLLENFNKHHFHLSNEKQLSFIPEKIPNMFHQLFSYCHPNPIYLKRLFTQKVVERMYASWRQALIDTVKAILDVSEDPKDHLDTLSRWDNSSYFPTYIMIECIWPFAGERNLMFDNDLAELYLSIPADVRGARILHQWTLWHLRKGLALLPDANSWVPPVVPESWQNFMKKIRPLIGNARRKIESIYRKGSILKTEGSWDLSYERYRKDKKYIEFIENCLFDQDVFPPEIFNLSEIEICWKEFLNGNLAGLYEIDALLSFGILNRLLPCDGIEI